MTLLEGLQRIPGNVGDSRLNNYFLENIYQFVVGGSDSLWHLPMFYPFPYILGFSDNLFGASPVYVVSRIAGAASDTAFQIWFHFGYLVNFAAAYYALRRLGGSVLAASVGAAIFAFALPTTAHAGHVQLHYRFGIPLAVVFFSEFIIQKNWKSLSISFAWLVWQFYAGVYMGFFALMILVAMLVTRVIGETLIRRRGIKAFISDYIGSWRDQTRQGKARFLSAFALLFALMILLFYPYLRVSTIYGATRGWSEIASMLPRPQSYILSDWSLFWADRDAEMFAEIPMRHEHQMFIGLIPAFLALLGLIIGFKKKPVAAFSMLLGALVIIVIFTLSVGGSSLWYLFHKLPLASAIRVMTRVDQALLFIFAYLAVIGLDGLTNRYRWVGIGVVGVVLPLFMLEMSNTRFLSSSKEAWRARIAALMPIIPKDLPEDAILFIAQQGEQDIYGGIFAELDAIWVSRIVGVKTVNGYSGNTPPNSILNYGVECSELPKRMSSYLKQQNISDPNEYTKLMARVTPLGFENCLPEYWQAALSITETDRAYTAEELSQLSYIVDLQQDAKQGNRAWVTIKNSGDFSFSARSRIGKPLRLSWRFLDENGTALTGWELRKDLPQDIPKKGKRSVLIFLEIPEGASALQVSMVQEADFWLHDIGIDPAMVPIK